MNIKLTKGCISREEAQKLSPSYVAFVDSHRLSDELLNPFMWDYEKTDAHGYATCALKKGQKMLTFMEGQFVVVKISSIKEPMHEADGPVVRVTNGEYSWRVDGAKFGVRI